MNRFLLPISAALLCAALLFAPIVAAYPDDTTPQQPLWASALSACVFLSAVLCLLAGRKDVTGSDKTLSLRATWEKGALAFAALIIWAGVSLLARLGTQHGAAYLGLMLHGLAMWATFGTAFALCIHLARQGRPYVYTLTGTLLAASAYVANNGLREYLIHLRAHESAWRVFGTSTPDFLAAYFVLLIPVTLAVLLRVPSGKELKSPLLGVALPSLVGLILLTQAMTLLATGSRFALVSVAVGVGTFLLTLWVAVRRGFVLDKTARMRLIALAVVVFVPAVVIARPVIARLSNLHDNSSAFRLWTWRGAAHMAAANPLTGAGVGTWQDTYPRYALVGFTRLAHNSYLQMADECGLPGLALLLLVLGSIAQAGMRGLSPASVVQETPALQIEKGRRRGKGSRAEDTPVLPPVEALSRRAIFQEPLLFCGLLGAVAGGVIQNLIDSDWYVFFFGLNFWAMAGLLVGLAGQGTAEPATAPRPARRLLLLGGSAIVCAYFLAQTTAAYFSLQGRTAQNPQDAQTDIALAQVWDDLNARHHTDMASRVYAAVGNLPAAEAEIRQAVRLQPNSGNFLRLGRVLAAQNKTEEALAAYQTGLMFDPNAVDLLLEAARLSPNGKTYYQRMADLEIGPVGTVRAIGEIVEWKFAYADAALGLYARAARLLEAYAGEGGSTNGQRQAMQNGQSNPAQDKELRGLYVTVMDGLARETPSAQQSELTQRRQKTLSLYDKLLAPPPNGVH